MIRKLINRIQMMIIKALVAKVDDSQDIQLVKLNGLDGEVVDGIEHMQPYGFTSNPPLGAGCILISPGGNRDDSVALTIDAGAFRKKDLDPGETASYSRFGQHLHYKLDGTAEHLAVRHDLLGFVNVGAVVGAVPLLKASPAFETIWSTYFTNAAAAWTALAGSGLFDPATVTALNLAATTATATASGLSTAHTTLSAGV